MATTVDTNQLNGLFKEVYADAVENLVPECGIVQKRVRFSEADKDLGNKYHQPVVVTQEHGVTYAGPDAGAFAINTPVALTMKDAQVQGYQMLLASRMSYDAAHRASQGKKAFVQATEFLVTNMVESLAKRVEVALLYGQTGLGQVNGYTNTSSTVTTVHFTTATWSAGIWTGAEGAIIEFFDGATQKGTDFTITAVDNTNRKITVSGSSGDITALETALGSLTLDVFWNGAKGNEMAGIDKIMTNTGTLFNVDASAYALWKSTSYSAGSASLNFNKINFAINQAVQRGLMEDVIVLCNPLTWADVANDLAALRDYDSSYSNAKLDLGAKSIMFHGVNGRVELVPHPMVKEGESFVLPVARAKRIGATDITFKVPGDPDDKVFIHLSGNAGFELRSYTDQAIFVDSPAKLVKITGIVNSAA